MIYNEPEDEVGYNVRRTIAMILGVERAGVFANLRMADIMEDSMDKIDCAMALEDEFAIIIDDQEFMQLETVDDVIGFVKRLVNFHD